MKNKPTIKPPIPTCRQFIGNPHSVSCLLSSSETAYPAQLATNPSPSSLYSYRWNISLSSLPSRWLSPSCLYAFVAMSQLRKTNPILSSPKPTQPSFPQRFMKKTHPYPTRKNKPNQTQFPRLAGTTSHIRHTTYEIQTIDNSKPARYKTAR
jgi:hypothetical protein